MRLQGLLVKNFFFFATISVRLALFRSFRSLEQVISILGCVVSLSSGIHTLIFGNDLFLCDKDCGWCGIARILST
ncbi:hypothetical protein BJ170DRAFT_8660 [Xylariales sp. AK1849]|nr:hypothetical protein BJ170DRAFT_8660 [Xylariales sp. AK1849]